jgi:ribosomal protein S18 acetylase RimI-like enzyme
MVEGYELRAEVPTVSDYLRLRAESGLTPKRPDQAEAGLPGSWWACHVVHQASGTVVGMGRVLGDGGWYFHLADIAVDPAHQRRGLGDAIMTALLARIAAVAPPDAWVTLLADPPGRRLYERHGFVPTAPDSVGMARVLSD